MQYGRKFYISVNSQTVNFRNQQTCVNLHLGLNHALKYISDEMDAYKDSVTVLPQGFAIPVYVLDDLCR